MKEKLELSKIDPKKEEYLSKAGHMLKREYGECPGGGTFLGEWVFRDPAGTYIDHGWYRNDIVDRNSLILNS